MPDGSPKHDYDPQSLNAHQHGDAPKTPGPSHFGELTPLEGGEPSMEDRFAAFQEEERRRQSITSPLPSSTGGGSTGSFGLAEHMPAADDAEAHAGGTKIEVADGDQDNLEHSSDERWNPEKARTIGWAVHESLYSPNKAGKEGFKDHPAETVFKKFHETDFEKLYDMNPEHFAQMPTNEFISLFRELVAVDGAIKSIEPVLDEYRAQKHKLLEEHGLSELPPLSGIKPLGKTS